MSISRGIILAGGQGSRLHPLTTTISKQLLPVYSVPLIYYPLATLMRHGIRDILLITRTGQQGLFRALLQDGSQWGISLSYAEQEAARGIPDAVLIGERFIGNDPFILMLGDNVLWQEPLDLLLSETPAKIFTVKVDNPEQFGIARFGPKGKIESIVEKPISGDDRDAVIGFYILDARAIPFAKALSPSARGELEIADLLKGYLDWESLSLQCFDDGVRWFDCGSPEGLLQASVAVAEHERQTGRKIACPEENAVRGGFITRLHCEKLMAAMPKTEYRAYLASVLERLR